MKKLLYLIGGGILMTFALLCFFEFFLAWNVTDIASLLFQAIRENGNLNFWTDLEMVFPLSYYARYSTAYGRMPDKFSLGDMIGSFIAPEGSYEYKGFLCFTRENWLQLALFGGVAVMTVLKLFKPEWVSGKALGIAFTALAVLAAWVLIKDFVEQWRYMFAKDNYSGGYQRWQHYYFGGRDNTSKFRVFLCIALHAGQNLLLVAAFASMAAVFMMPSFKNLFFVPAFVAAAYAAVMFLLHLTGWGFALKWGFGAALIFLIVDGLLAAGLFVTGLAAKNE